MNAPMNRISQDRAYEFIRSRIPLLECPAHSRLKALDIASELKLSRTPVREALGRLEQDGLVNLRRRTGICCAGRLNQDASDVYKARETLEIEAAREAIAQAVEIGGSPTWAPTRDLRINSRAVTP